MFTYIICLSRIYVLIYVLAHNKLCVAAVVSNGTLCKYSWTHVNISIYFSLFNSGLPLSRTSRSRFLYFLNFRKRSYLCLIYKGHTFLITLNVDTLLLHRTTLIFRSWSSIIYYMIICYWSYFTYIICLSRKGHT
jgi:hypothetical protein